MGKSGCRSEAEKKYKLCLQKKTAEAAEGREKEIKYSCNELYIIILNNGSEKFLCTELEGTCLWQSLLTTVEETKSKCED